MISAPVRVSFPPHNSLKEGKFGRPRRWLRVEIKPFLGGENNKRPGSGPLSHLPTHAVMENAGMAFWGPNTFRLRDGCEEVMQPFCSLSIFV